MHMAQHQLNVGRWRFAFLMALAFLALGGLTATWRMHSLDGELRQQLLIQAMEIAGTLDADLVHQLTFTPADCESHAFTTLGRQLSQYGKCIPQRSIYTMALRENEILFGPENLPTDDPMASPPGTVFQQPDPAIQAAVRDGIARVVGPVTDEYGTFITAAAPVLDPATGSPLMLVGIDLSVENWRSQLLATALTSAWWALAIMAVLATGTALIRRRHRHPDMEPWLRHVETAMTAIIGLTMTIAVILLTNETESRHHRMLLQRRMGLKAEMLRDELRTIQSHLGALGRFFEASTHVERAEFEHFAAPLARPDHIAWLGWAPHVPARDRAAWATMAAAEGIADFAPWRHDHRGQPIPLPRDADAHSVLYIAPLAPATAALVGLDLASDAERHAIIAHAATYGTAAAIFAPIPDPAAREDLCILHPLRIPVPGGGISPDAIHTEADGLVLGMIHLPTLLRSVLGRHEQLTAGMNVGLLDLSSPGTPAIVEYPARTGNHRLRAPAPPEGGTFPFVHPLFVFGKAYALAAQPATANGILAPLRSAWLPGTSALLVTMLLTIFVAFLRQRQEALAALVEERTADLAAEHLRLVEANQMLRENENRIRKLIDNLHQGMVYQVVRHPDGTRHFTYLSDAVRRFHGISPEQAMTDPSLVYRQIHPDESALFREAEEKANQSGSPFRLEARMMTPEGGIRWSYFISTPTRLPDGSTRWDGIEFDITERKQAEAALRESERRITALMANLPGMAYRCLRDANWTMQFVSKGCLGLTGYAYDELVGDHAIKYGELIHPHDRDYVRETVDRQVERRQPFHLVYRILARDGAEKFVWEQGVGVFEDGQAVALEGFIADITARRQAEEKLEIEHAQMLSIFEAINSTIYVADMDTHRIVYANQAARDMFGGDLIGQVCHQALQGLEAPCSFCTNDHLRAIAPQPYFWEFHNSKVNRTYRLIDRIIRWPDGRDLRFEMAMDITDLKRAERERLEMERKLLHAQKLESLGVMAGGIAHDFNNLLMVILGNMELAMMQLAASSPVREHLDDAILGARRAAELTRHMLDYSGRGLNEMRRISLNELVRDNAEILKSAIGRNISLQLQLDETIPAVMADRGQLQQIVMNLVINAAEAMSRDGGIVAVRSGIAAFGRDALAASRVEEKPQPGQFIWVEVADSGCGMDEITQARLFDPFFTTKFTGRGLGMAAVLGIVRGHSGAIFVNSKPGAGTTIRVLLPANREEPADAQPASTKTTLLPAMASRTTSPREYQGGILVVDDEEMLRRICAEMLEKLGYRPFLAADGETAVRLLRDHGRDIDGAIVDLTMPGMDGIATFAALRSLQPGLKGILSSGFNERDIAHRRANPSWHGFIHKPFSISDLHQALASLADAPRTSPKPPADTAAG
jgi:PAS domain S-box-containing protein